MPKWIALRTLWLGYCLSGVLPAHAEDKEGLRVPASALKERRELIQTALPHLEYQIIQEGTLDGESTREPLGWRPPGQTWESNRRVTIENIDDVDLVNPWISNGRTSFRTAEDFLASVVRPDMTDQEKALAIWWVTFSMRFHGDDHQDSQEPIDVFNGYGFNTCGGASVVLVRLWKLAGLRARLNLQPGHVVPEVWYDDAWHMLDGDMGGIYFDHDNRTIASHAKLVDDHWLIKRARTGGPLGLGGPPEPKVAVYYALNRLFSNNGRHLSHDDLHLNYWLKSYDKTRLSKKQVPRSMDMRLRPGESISFHWSADKTVRYVGADFSGEGRKAVWMITNGFRRYVPDFGKQCWENGVVWAAGVKAHPGRLEGLHNGGEVVWAMESPYPLVGAEASAQYRGVSWQLSWNGLEWHPVELDRIDAEFRGNTVRRMFFLRALFINGGTLDRIGIVARFQAARACLPGMRLGENRFAFTQSGTTRTRIIHEWIESNYQSPPGRITEFLSPVGDEAGRGASVRFSWRAPKDTNGDAVRIYHIQVSHYLDMRWPVAPTFDRVITAAGRVPRVDLFSKQLLEPGREYYWRIRARDAGGLWGGWSEAMRFQVAGPAAPMNVRVAIDPNRSKRLHVSWRVAGWGTTPIKYEVHASSESAFTVSARTRIAEVREQEFAANETRALKAFYRIVAIDADGNRSAASALAEFPRPFIASHPPESVAVGAIYSYAPFAVTSMGDERAYDPSDNGLWDQDRPKWTLLNGPSWLKFEGRTLRGRVPAAGVYPVKLRLHTRTGVVEQEFVIAAGRPGMKTATISIPHVPSEIQEIVDRFYAALIDRNIALRDCIAPELLGRISRVDSSSAFLHDALEDLRDRSSEYGEIDECTLFPMDVSETCADVVVRLRHAHSGRVFYDRLTLICGEDERWRVGRAR